MFEELYNHHPDNQIGLTDYDRGLVEAAHLLACLAIPWAWLLGLSLPTAMGATRYMIHFLSLDASSFFTFLLYQEQHG